MPENEGQDIYVTDGMVRGIYENRNPGKKTNWVVQLETGDKFSTFDPNLIMGMSKGNQAIIYFKINGNFKNIVPPPQGDKQEYQPPISITTQPHVKPYYPSQTQSATTKIPTPVYLPQSGICAGPASAFEEEDKEKPMVSDMRKCNAVTNATLLVTTWINALKDTQPEVIGAMNKDEILDTVKTWIKELEK